MHKIRRAAVIGAGTMGAGIAAQLANANIPTLLLDLPTDGPDRNKVARTGLERAIKARPGAFMAPDFASRITVGNTEDDLAKVAECDWVVEAVIEKLDAKQDLLAKLEKVVSPTTIVSSNSSGIPMKYQAAKLSNGLKSRFLGTHFFNPPRYLHLLELIPTKDTDPRVIETLREFGDRVLGKGIVVAHDVPGFAANRIGIYATNKTFQVAEEMGLSPDVVDALTGPLIGRPKSATFRTADLVGIDILHAVGVQLHAATQEDVKPPAFVDQIVERKWLGDKTGQGFYKKTKEGGQTKILTLNLKTWEYEDRGKVRLAELADIIKIPSLSDRMKALLEADNWVGDFTRRTFIPLVHFAASKIGVVAGTPQEVDNALKWGFGWEQGPLELADSLGRAYMVSQFGKAGLEVPDYFKGAPAPAPANAPLALRQVRDKKVLGNEDASLWDVGDGVALLEFHSKANSIGAKVLEIFDQAHERVSRDFAGLVIGNEGENFCAGADLNMLLYLAQSNNFEEIRAAVRQFQGMTSRLRFAPYPVVVCPHKLVLGGGCEVALWGDSCAAAAELYTGLVEVGVGILPAGGGTTEMLLRKTAALTPGADPFLAVQQAFELIALAKVSSSAFEARNFGFLRETDTIVMNPDRVLEVGKQKVLQLAPGYTAPQKRTVTVLGESALANLRAGAMLMHESGHISEYEVHLATKVGEVLTGGNLNHPDEVSEEFLLELEGEAFLHLCGQEKTRERLAHMLKTGKPLRN